MAITITQEQVDSRLAKKWLQKNENNRPYSDQYADSLAHAMSRGEWEETGDPIRFNGDLLIDGQHRLNAIIKCGRKLKMTVVRGLSEKAYDVIDQVRSRSLADVLHRNGEPYYAELSTAIRWYALEKKLINKNVRLTNPLGVSILKKRPGLRNSVDYIIHDCDLKRIGLISAGMAAGLHYAMCRYDRSKADKFWLQIGTGEKLSRKSAAWKLRDILIQNKAAVEKLDRNSLRMLCVKAWNAYRQGKNFDRKLRDEDRDIKIK